MGYRGSIEVTYTTNKNILPEELLQIMRESFERSEEYLDIETSENKQMQIQMDQAHAELQKINPEKLRCTRGISNTEYQ